MPLIMTPRRLAQRSELYHQLASLTAAGIGLIRALEMMYDSPPSRSFRKPLALALGRLQEGSTFNEALRATSDWIPAFDSELLRAGEQSGRLDACFRLLAGFYNERARLARSVISDLLYPLVTVHVALLVFPPHLITQLLWEGKAGPFVWQKITAFVPLYGIIFLALYACQGRHGEWWRGWLERLLHRVPMVGSARRSLALARLSSALEGLLRAGVSIIEAWEMAAAASGSPTLKRAVLAWRPGLEAGRTPSELVHESRAFPELFASLYSTGEISGQLDETLTRLSTYYHEEGSRKLRELATWTPRLIYFGLMILIAYKVITFWVGYYSNILDGF